MEFPSFMSSNCRLNKVDLTTVQYNAITEIKAAIELNWSNNGKIHL